MGEVSAECSRIEQTLLGEIGRTEAIARIAEDRAEQAHSTLSATSSAVGASAKQLEEKLAEEAVRHAQQARKDLSDAVLVLNEQAAERHDRLREEETIMMANSLRQLGQSLAKDSRAPS